MKPAKFTWVFWLGNLVVLGALSVFLFGVYSETGGDRNATGRTIANLHSELERRSWKPSGDTPGFAPKDMRLSAIARPKPPEPPPPEDEPEPQPTAKSDEQLRDELQAELNRKFTLLRMILSNSAEYSSCAFLVSNGTRLQWFEDMYLKEEYGKSSAPELRKLAYDLHVLTIDKDCVLVKAASFEKPEKHFEVRISVDYASENMSFSGALFPREDDVLRPEHGEDKAKTIPFERDSDRRKAEEWGYPIPDDDEIDELAKYTKPTDNGLQILPELPEDSPARKYGARGGEIIKTINGVSVKSMSDVRRIVRTQYDAGTREFVVGFEKDGLPDTRTFKAPEKKD